MKKLRRLISKRLDHGCQCTDPRCGCERTVFLSFFSVCRPCREQRHPRDPRRKPAGR